jgi:hypothetical protein
VWVLTGRDFGYPSVGSMGTYRVSFSVCYSADVTTKFTFYCTNEFVVSGLEEQRMRVFENKTRKKKLEYKKDEVTE